MRLTVSCPHCYSPDTARVWPTFPKAGDWARYVCHECQERFSARTPGEEALMDAPFYNGEPGARPYDEDWGEGVSPVTAETYICSDCGEHGETHFHVIATTGHTLCDPCYRYRAKHGWEFDARPIQVLTAQGAA